MNRITLHQLAVVLLCLLLAALVVPSVSPQDPPCPIEPRLSVGSFGRVLTATGSGVNIRTAAANDAPLLGVVPAGEVFSVVAGPSCTETFVYWQIDFRGIVGWAAEGTFGDYFVEPSAAPLPGGTTPSNCPVAPRLTPGDNARIVLDAANTPNRLRSSPNAGNNQIGSIPAGAMLIVLEGPVCDGRFTWWRVNYNNQVGWTAEGGSDGVYWMEPTLLATSTPSLPTPSLPSATPPLLPTNDIEAALPLSAQNVAALRSLYTRNFPYILLDASSGASLMALAGAEQVLLIHEFTGSERLLEAAPGTTIEQVALSPDGTQLALFEYSFDADQAQVRLFRLASSNPPTPTLTLALPLPGRLSRQMAFNATGSQLAIATSDGSSQMIHVLNPQLGTLIETLLVDAFPADLAYHPTRDFLAVAQDNGQVKLWDTSVLPFGKGSIFNAFNPEERRGGNHSLTFSPDGTQLFYGGNYNVVQAWDLLTEAPADITLSESGYSILDLAYVGAGALRLVSAGAEMTGEGALIFLDGSGTEVLAQPIYSRFVLSDPARPLIHIFTDQPEGSTWAVWGVAP